MSGRRLASVDVFRGVTMAAMVIVNNPGDWAAVYAPLRHAEWHGWTPTDLVFPFFLFLVGVSITHARTTRAGWLAVGRRGLIILGLGLLLSGFPYYRLETMRLPGVLQRIALCYVAAATTVRLVGESRRRVAAVAALSAAVLAGYCALLLLVPVPGGAAGDLGPGRDLGAWLDRRLLGGHLWRPDWDPEGLLSTAPAVATTLSGVLAGWWMQARAGEPARLRLGLAVAGAVAIAAGYAWHPWFPINKNLWTSSYVLFTAGAAAIGLALCHGLVEPHAPIPQAGGRRYHGAIAEAFVALGRNAILLFVISGVTARVLGIVRFGEPAVPLKTWIYAGLFAPVAAPQVASLLFALANLAALWALLWALHRRGVYLTV
ncbi:MAG: heparan-alpha-glucosaminide N-acetyltransferase domain-containing protein [Acidobacteriota bacterium]